MLACEVPLPRASVRPCGQGEEVTARDDDTPLEDAKRRVPTVVARIGRARWNVLVNPPQRSKAPTISRAYHKLHEITLSCVLPRVATSLHLCEAPGGFVQCARDHLAQYGGRWEWMAVSLGDGIAFDASLQPPSSLLHADVISDTDRVVAAARARFPDGVELVTADGAVAMDHDHLEEAHVPLLWAECRVALACLRVGGHFVVKFFEGLRPCTHRVVAVLTQHFRETVVIKPTGSRPTNSERYLVCRDFLGTGSDGASSRVVVAEAWVVEFDAVMRRFARAQTAALERAFASVSEPVSR